MALWLKTLKHLIVQVLTLALYRGKKKKQTGLLMRLSIAYLFWATIIGFLIQIFLTLGKTGVGSECTPPLLALWLSFLLITWDPLGRLWGAADVGETCRGEITCWECLAVAVQRSPPPAPAQFLTEPIALWDAVAWLLLLAAQSASLLHPNAFFQKKKNALRLYTCILWLELLKYSSECNFCQASLKRVFTVVVPVCSCYFKRWEFLSRVQLGQ